jgi:SAM-dependent methyltransferase
VLELACGPGGVGIAAAELVGPAGEVVLSDIAAEMTAIAANRAAAAGLGNVRTLTLDLDDLDQPDQAYDVVVCREGLMFALDPAHAVAEMRRILRPGGRVALAVWGPRARNPWLALLPEHAKAQLRARLEAAVLPTRRRPGSTSQGSACSRPHAAPSADPGRLAQGGEAGDRHGGGAVDGRADLVVELRPPGHRGRRDLRDDGLADPLGVGVGQPPGLRPGGEQLVQVGTSGGRHGASSRSRAAASCLRAWLSR